MHAGQGIVAFAQGVHDDLGYALKFFVERESFLAERDMYRSQTLGRLSPQVRRCHGFHEHAWTACMAVATRMCVCKMVSNPVRTKSERGAGVGKRWQLLETSRVRAMRMMNGEA